MITNVLIELKRRVTLKFLVVWLLITCIPLIIAILRSGSYAFRDSLDFYTFILEDVVTLLFPFVILFIYLIFFTSEIQDRFLAYTRLRAPIESTINVKFLANGLMTFIAVFLSMIIFFLFAFYLEPFMQFANMRPELYGLNEQNITEDTYNRHTFTQLLRYGTVTYGVLYSGWVALNAACYVSLGFMFVILVNNRFFALSIPFLVYFIGSFLAASFNLDPYQFTHSIFPYGYIQGPIWKSFVPFIILVLLIIGMYTYVRSNISKLERLT
ncbi:hypothetical protein BK126_05680 [Paenibacillus sp. FSL H7-0326]|nr:hypothetical protein BK126_05680 [Paenibacillus sp. FSL H7-0326]